MQITPHIHSLRIDFQVTPEIRRFVHIFLLIGRQIHLIDAGVAGTAPIIAEYLASMGRRIEEIGNLFLTHSHPDHIGGAEEIKRLTGCTVHASAIERNWIENIDLQFKERPIPNFHTLLNEPVGIDTFITDGDSISCENGITLEVLDTPGHSAGSQCFLFHEQRALFTGDAIPVEGDIPIYVSPGQCERSWNKLLDRPEPELYLSAWDHAKNREEGRQTVRNALARHIALDAAVRRAAHALPEATFDLLFKHICREMELEHWERLAPFRQSIVAHLEELKTETAEKKSPLNKIGLDKHPEIG